MFFIPELSFLFLPIILYIFLGFLAGALFSVDRLSVANILVHLVVPIVIFDALSKMKWSLEISFLPLALFFLSTILSLCTYKFFKIRLSDSDARLMGAMVGMANSGYFGLPLALIILPPEGVGLYMYICLGFTLHEYLVVVPLTLSKKWSVVSALKQIFSLPGTYGAILGVVAAANSLNLPKSFDLMISQLRGVYVVLGMMLIGIVTSNLKDLKIRTPLIWSSLAIKLIVWPLIANLFIMILTPEVTSFQLLKKILILISILPIGANVIVYATLSGRATNNAGLCVLISTLLSVGLAITLWS